MFKVIKWNGTSITPEDFSQVSAKDSIHFCEFHKDGIKYSCISRSSADPYPCVVDELKPFFGLPKLGTRFIKRGSTCTLLIRNLPPIVRISDLPTDELKPLENEIRKTYLFRELTGMSVNFDRSLILRDQKEVVSFHDTCSTEGETSTMERKVIYNLFGDMRTFVREMKLFIISNMENKEKDPVIYYSEIVQDIVSRIDTSVGYLVTDIGRKIKRYMLKENLEENIW